MKCPVQHQDDDREQQGDDIPTIRTVLGAKDGETTVYAAMSAMEDARHVRDIAAAYLELATMPGPPLPGHDERLWRAEANLRTVLDMLPETPRDERCRLRGLVAEYLRLFEHDTPVVATLEQRQERALERLLSALGARRAR